MSYLSSIPEIYRPWFKEAGLDFDLSETKATCNACTMAVAQKFSSELKCCTFQPLLPNYIVGLYCAQGGLYRSISESNGLVALPIGLAPTPAYKDVFARSPFGQNPALLCQFYVRENGKCGVWNLRPSTCVGFVCQSSYGERGQKIWAATEALLNLLESTLAHEALLQIGFTDDEITAGELAEFGDCPEVLYKKCYAVVAAIPSQEVWSLVEQEASFEIQRLHSAFAALR